ncbi:MAG TPA: rod shape-determining protein RodA, partial [Geobacter sp.]|nr:rod shape-determining protein RodA [Geobacter sp.]
MFDRRLFTNFDWTLLVVVLLVTGFGVVNIYSASSSYRDIGTPYFLKQLYWIVAGLTLCLTVCSLDYHLLEDFAYWLYGAVLILLVMVLLVGKTTMGATRWIDLGFFNIQPSEPMKIVIIMTFARFFSRYPVFKGLTLRDLAYPLLLLGVPALLIMKQPDLGTAVLVSLIGGTML